MAYSPTAKSIIEEKYKSIFSEMNINNKYLFKKEEFMGNEYSIFKIKLKDLPNDNMHFHYFYKCTQQSSFFSIIVGDVAYLCKNKEILRNLRKELNIKKGGKYGS